mgnify:CR=1 FL=1
MNYFDQLANRRARKKKLILERVSIGQTKVKAARGAGIHRKTLRRWLDADPDFARQFEAAWQQGAKLRDYYGWLNHPFRGLRPPTGKGTRARPRYSR